MRKRDLERLKRLGSRHEWQSTTSGDSKLLFGFSTIIHICQRCGARAFTKTPPPCGCTKKSLSEWLSENFE